jgi:hypothetical protein
MEGKKIADRILELEKEYGKLSMAVCFRIAEEVAKQKYSKFASLPRSYRRWNKDWFLLIQLLVLFKPD